jgi:hypothetical protein
MKTAYGEEEDDAKEMRKKHRKSSLKLYTVRD